jgi:hypothetical protein
MADTYNAVTIDGTADVIIANLTGRRTLIIKNVGSAIVYIGLDSSVASTTGLPINPQGSIELNCKHYKRGTAIYGVTASGSSEVRYLLFEE